ncbi:MAG: hypothetical protein ACI9BD_001284, partial [Candidatus Marinamargulisbacteria bacterium]
RLIGILPRGNHVTVVKIKHAKQQDILEAIHEIEGKSAEITDNLELMFTQIDISFFAGCKICCCFPEDELILQTVKLPSLQKRYEYTALSNQLGKLEQTTWDYENISSPDIKIKESKFLVYKAKDESIKAILDVFSQKKLYLHTLVPEARIVQNLLKTKTLSIAKTPTTLFLDLDDKTLKLSVFENQTLVYFRHIKSTLGSAFTQFSGTNKLDSNAPIPSDVQSPIKQLVQDIKASISYYLANARANRIDQGFIFGELLANGPFCAYYFSKELEIPIEPPSLSPERLAFKENSEKLQNSFEDPDNTISRVLSATALTWEENEYRPLNLLPDKHIHRRYHKTAIRTFAIGAIITFLAIVGLSFKYKIALKSVNHKIAIQRKPFDKIEKEWKRMKTKIDNDTERTKSIGKLQKYILRKAPVEDFIYGLSHLEFKELVITRIEIHELTMKIFGEILADQVTIPFATFLNTLKTFPFLKDINYRIFEGREKKISTFAITASFIKEDK